MTTFKNICIALLAISFSTVSIAQNTKGNKDKSSTPSAADAMKSMFGGGADGTEAGGNPMTMFGGKADVAESYQFDHNLKLLMENTDGKGKITEMTTIMYLSDSNDQMGMKLLGEEATGLDYTIIDMGKEQMITLMNNDGSKMGMVMRYKDAVKDAESDKEGDYTYTFEKTGNTDVISGQSCEEYLLKSTDPKDDTRTTVWMAPDGNSAWMDSFSRMAKDKKASWTGKMPSDYPEGGLVRVVNVDGKSKSVMTVVESNLNQPTTITTGAYTFMNFGG